MSASLASRHSVERRASEWRLSRSCLLVKCKRPRPWPPRQRSSFTSAAVMEKAGTTGDRVHGEIQVWLSPVALQRDRHFRLAAFLDDKQRAAFGCPGKAGLAVVPGEGSTLVRRDGGPQEFLVVVSEVEADEG